MPKSYRQLLMDTEVHDELLAVRQKLNEIFHDEREQLGLASVIRILLEHYRNALPTEQWIREQVMAAPRRGRPRTSNPYHVPAPKGVKAQPLGHKFVQSAGRTDVVICTVCGDIDNAEYPGGRWRCGFRITPWRKSELIDLQFTEEQIALFP